MRVQPSLSKKYLSVSIRALLNKSIFRHMRVANVKADDARASGSELSPHSKLVDLSCANIGKRINKKPPSSTCSARAGEEAEKFINYVRSHTSLEILFPSSPPPRHPSFSTRAQSNGKLFWGPCNSVAIFKKMAK